ncbi:MAG: uracil-DNA glycosylase [Verrucomicrobiota bacterium]
MPSSRSVADGLKILQVVLERDRKRGRETVGLSPEAEEQLRQLPVDLLSRVSASPDRESVSSAVKSIRPAPPKEEFETDRASTESGASSRSEPAIPRDEELVRQQLNEIFRDAKSCDVCRGLGTLRDQIVFATGNPLADLMFVGEAPGAEEEKERKPFVGPAGQKLTQIIGAMGLSREEVYISNIVKFRPKKGDGRFQGSGNRKPDQTEMEASIRFIRREIEVVSPRVIVALGATAAEGLLQRGGTISGLRGRTHEFGGVPVIVTYHPSFLLRQESESDQVKAKAMKRRVWEDMLRAMEILEMPISEKQQKFFL